MTYIACTRVIVAAALAVGLAIGGFAPAVAVAAGGGLPDSSSRVDVTAAFSGARNEDGSRELQVRLDIAPGWHVNANPASLAFLVPTVVAARVDGDPVALQVAYPDGHRSGIELGGGEVMVYSNGATIAAKLPAEAVAAVRQAGGVDVVVQVQSCSNDGVCLAPASIMVPVR